MPGRPSTQRPAASSSSRRSSKPGPRRGSGSSASAPRRSATPAGPVPQLRIGCSGWNYKSWRARFYPADLPASKWLDYYATVFDTVEVNNTFYRLPDISTFDAWRAQAPPGFLMAIKASRFLTHLKKLKDPDEPIARLFAEAAGLKQVLGPILYQLPGNFPLNLERFERFLTALPRRRQHVIEFRHTSWYVEEVFALMERRGVALCLHDKEGSQIREPFVGPFVYVRFHGTSGRYTGSYSDATLSRWADRLVERWNAGHDVYAYFNNDPDAVATVNARTLQQMCRARVRT
jgi:uncharacterized protein YecE (DUF72 family)